MSTVAEPKYFLRVKGNQMCVGDEPVILKGACLGGWMAMEAFISGYPATEFDLREGMLKALGKEKYEFFFDKYLEYFFTEADVQLYKDLGFNCIRLGFGYRHFEDDDNPRVFKKEGLKHLDRVVDLCAKAGIYTVLDLHSLPGGQNNDWHCDNDTTKALFWRHKDFQDRAVWLWENLAEHYKDNVSVAGYNVLNEPLTENNDQLNRVMARFEKAIRAIDPNHIIFWDGNGFASDFRGFDVGLPNCVYACHDYNNMGNPGNPQYYGTEEDKAKVHQSFEWKSEFQRSIGGPIWNGEFGPAYADPEHFPDHEEINARRYALLLEQLKVYSSFPNVSWNIWCWKDIGTCALLKVNPESAYIKLLKPFIEKKRVLAIDSHGVDVSHLQYLFKPMWDWLCEAAPSMRTKYPKVFAGDRGKHLFRPVRMILLAEELVPEYCSYFKDKSFEELDELARSFHLDNCVQRTELVEMLKDFAKQS